MSRTVCAYSTFNLTTLCHQRCPPSLYRLRTGTVSTNSSGVGYCL